MLAEVKKSVKLGKALAHVFCKLFKHCYTINFICLVSTKCKVKNAQLDFFPLLDCTNDDIEAGIRTLLIALRHVYD